MEVPLASICDSSEEPDNKRAYGIYPYHPLRRTWEYAMYIVCLLSLWELPFEWFFNFPMRWYWVLPALFLDVLCFADIFIYGRTGVLHFGLIELDRETIRADIKKWKLVIFWLSPWPIYLIGFFMDNRLVFRILICLKLLRIVRLVDARNRINNTLIYISSYSKIAVLFSILFTIVHVCTCIFWFIGNQELPGESWLKDVVQISDKDEFIQYLHTFYYATTTILTVGYGDIHPHTFNEILCVICMEACGVLFYNILVSSMVSILANPSKNAFMSRYQRIYAAFKWRGVSDEALLELLRYYDYVWEQDRNQLDFYETVQKMPESLQKRLALSLHLSTFNRIEKLRNCDLDMLESIALALKPKVFTPGDYLIKAGRVSSRLYILAEGTVDVISRDGLRLKTFDGSVGVIIGESSLATGNEEPVSIMANTYVEAFELSKDDFDEITELAEILRRTETPHPSLY